MTLRPLASAWTRCAALLVTLALPLLLALPARASTLEFGQNLRVHLHLHEVDPDREEPLARIVKQSVQSVQHDLGSALSGDLHVDFVGGDEAFRKVLDANGAQGWSEAWISGLALLGRGRILVQVNGPGALLTSEVVHHELVHMAIHSLGHGHRLPRWYHEGVAMYLAGEATYERLRNQAGSAAFGQLDSLAKLDDGFFGSQVSTERAYAMAAGFVRFAVQRAGHRHSLVELHDRMGAGMGFEQAFSATFGQPPEQLYAAYATQVGTAGARWVALLTDEVLWSVTSLLSAIALIFAWRHRPKFAQADGPAGDGATGPDDEPVDLEAVAAAGEAAAARPWHLRDFSKHPLALPDEAPHEAPADTADDPDRKAEAPGGETGPTIRTASA